jgi:transcriptional regulator with XRE-family HTH domain
MALDRPPTVAEVLARKVREYRDAQGLRQEDLADRCTELGWPMNRVTIAKIEAGGTRAENASLTEVLVLALALDVPPPLMFLPLGDGEEVTIADLKVHPHIALDWVAGETPISALPDNFARNVEAWGGNAQKIKLFRGLRERQDAAYRAEGRVKSFESQRMAEPAAAARQQFDHALIALAAWLEAVHAAGEEVSISSLPEMPPEWRERMAKLGVNGGQH